MCPLVLKTVQQYGVFKDSHSRFVTVDDFNNDNRLDIAVVNTDADNIGIFLGYGNNTFMDELKCPTGFGSTPYHIALGDFDNDQHLDLAVANFGTHNIGIFRGKGNGNFTEHIKLSTGPSRPQWIAVGDFNNDTYLDIAIVNYGTNSIGVMLGNGNGNFTIQKNFSTGYDSFPNSLVVADLNSDKKLDIAVANYGTNNVAIFVGDGNGSFTFQAIFTTGINSYPYYITTAYFNNDTILDIAVTNSGTDNVGFLFGLGNGTFSEQIMFSTGYGSKPQSLIVKDFNNDMLLDIAVASYATNNISVFFGNGIGNFRDQMTFDVGYYSNPNSIAYGDFNNDGRVDIVCVNNDTNHLNLLINFEGVTFYKNRTYPTGLESTPYSVAVGDFDRDGHSDIVVATSDFHSVNIFLGSGNGDFPRQTNYSTGSDSAPVSVAVGDFNQDNLLDIVVTNKQGDNIYILFGTGDGTFSNPINYTTGDNSEPLSVAIGDFNNDNRSDIVVANHRGNNLGVFLNNGNGTFSNQVSYSTSRNTFPISVAVGDFNNDDQLDIAFTNELTDYIGIFYGCGNGTFLNETEYFTQTASYPYWIAVDDLNNDNYLDIAVANTRSGTVSLLFGKGNGSFSTPPMMLTCDNGAIYSIAVGDFNNDNNRDIVITNWVTNNIGVFLGYGNGSFTNQKRYLTGDNSGPVSVAVGNFDNDYLNDIVVANSLAHNIEIFFALSEFDLLSLAPISTGSSPHLSSLAIGNLNNDSAIDVVIVNSGYNEIKVLLGSEDGTFPIQIKHPTGSSSFPTFVIIDYFNNDNWFDVAIVNSGINNVDILSGYGNGSFFNPRAYSTGIKSDPRSIASGDFNNDNKNDIVVVNYGTNNVFVFLNSDIGSFRSIKTYPTGDKSNPRSVAIGDLNNDSLLDIVATNDGYNDISIFLGYGNGTFQEQKLLSNDYNAHAYSIAVADFNQDSLTDIVVANMVAENVGIFLGHGDGTFSGPKTFPTGNFSKPSSVTTGDFNNDGRIDIVVANYASSNVGVFLGYGNGTFSKQLNYSTGYLSGPISVAVGDFNNDGQLDIVVANYASSNVGVFLGYGNGTFSEQFNYSTGSDSEPISVAVGDFNKDKKLDIVVANSVARNIGIFFGYGDGTFSNQAVYNLSVTNAYPRSVAVGDLNHDSWLDVVVTDSDTHNIHIFLGFFNGTFFSPFMHTTGVSLQPWAVAIGDFDNNNRSDITVVNYGSNNMDVFLGYASDGFLKAMEYPTGSSSQPVHVAVGHFDNDSYLDIAVANSGTHSVMILLGSGYGTFLSHTDYPTGYYSNPCWVAVGDLNNDNRPDIAVANAGSNSIGIFLGQGNGSFFLWTLVATGFGSTPCSLAVIDVDKDTKLDIVVANFDGHHIDVLYGNSKESFERREFLTTIFGSRPMAVVVTEWNEDVFLFAINDGTNDIDVISRKC